MKQPKIRFNGFEDEWTKIPLKDVISKISLKNKDTSVKYVESISNSRGFIPQSSQFSDRSVASKDLSNYTVIHEGDIAYNPSRINVGSIALKKSGTDVSVISPLYIAFRPKYDILSPWFLMEWLNTSNFESQRVGASEGGVRDTLSYGSFSRFKVQLPSLSEQQKIGALFSKYDAIIALREQKLAELNALKKGMLQQMFPKNGAKVPELRFAGFADDWEERKLRDISDYRNGKAHEQVEDEQGKFTIINSKFVSTDGKVKRNTCMQVEPMFKGELAVVLSDLPNGKALAKVFLVDENDKYTLNQRIAGINPKESVNSTFLKYRMNRHSYFLKFDSGVSQTNLSKSQVEEFATLYPSLKEQQKIGQLFKHLDARISNEQNKIEQLKAQKQGLLQKMIS